ncbi:peptidase inhibitor family I36 protein [Streptomyces roseirectus]|uniref:Peptidase inhibitor family I36 protein n=1 Tax=Streptomyces roseirectus TaxID=2768066 RepID=A0A7H0IQR1_9ACTN|nr:peptidase inhibitor family I36 protein [Streptomyces roseirectus]QNP75127.1 peptidase inhibitor family I36 protein [Streptomyces roseirectus]
MNIRTRLTMVSLAAVLSAGGLGLTLAPSAAAEGSPAGSAAGQVHIQSGTLHLYEKNSFKGGWIGLTKTDKDLRSNYFDNGKKVDNQTSSVKNYTNKYVDLWQNVSCTGAHTTSYPGTQDGKLSNDAIKDNRLSCVKFR